MSTAYAGAAGALWQEKISVPRLFMFANESQTPRGYSDESRVIVGQLRAAQIDYAFPVTRQEIEIADRFYGLGRQWRQETLLSSSVTEITSSPAYREIVDMGWQIVPYILSDLRENPDHWFTALREITGANPVPPQNRGNLAAMADDWLAWAEAKGIAC